MAVVQYWIPEHERGKFLTVFLGKLKPSECEVGAH